LQFVTTLVAGFQAAPALVSSLGACAAGAGITVGDPLLLAVIFVCAALMTNPTLALCRKTRLRIAGVMQAVTGIAGRVLERAGTSLPSGFWVQIGNRFMLLLHQLADAVNEPVGFMVLLSLVVPTAVASATIANVTETDSPIGTCASTNETLTNETLVHDVTNATSSAPKTPLGHGREIFEAVLLAAASAAAWPVLRGAALVSTVVQLLYEWAVDLDYSRPMTFAYLATLAMCARVAHRLGAALWQHVLQPSRPVQVLITVVAIARRRWAAGLTALGRAVTLAPSSAARPRPALQLTDDTPELNMEPGTPMRGFPNLGDDLNEPATPGLVVPASTHWAAIPKEQRARWDGGARPTAPVDASGHEREQQAREKRLLAKYVAKMDAKDYASADTLENVVPCDRFVATDVTPILKALRVLDAMLLATTSYANERPDITVGQMQYLLLQLLDRQVNGRWTRLREFVQQHEDARWSDIVSEACRLLGVRTKADWETVLRSFTRTSSGKRPLTFLEYANRFITVARASGIARDSADLRNSTLLHEYFIRGAQSPGFVHWAQERLMPPNEARSEAYTDLGRSQQLAVEWDRLNERAKTTSVQAEWRWGAEALKESFQQLHADTRPTLRDLWGADTRERALQLFPEHEQVAIRKVLDGTQNNYFVPGGVTGGPPPATTPTPLTSQPPQPPQRRGEQQPQPSSRRGEARGKGSAEKEPTPLLPQHDGGDQGHQEVAPPLVEGALEALKTRPPTMRDLRRHRLCWKCGRKYPDCRREDAGGKGCSHRDAAKLRWNLFAYFPYPSIFFPEVGGQRVSPMDRLNEEEQGAVLARIAALGPDVQRVYPLQRATPAPAAGGAAPSATPVLPNLLAREAKQDTETADTIAQAILTGIAPLVTPAELIRGIRGHESAWIADVHVGSRGITTHALVDPGGSANMITASLARRAGLRVRPYSGPQLSWGVSTPIAIHGMCEINARPKSLTGPRHIGEAVVVDDTALPVDQQLLLGVTALQALRAVPDMADGLIYWKSAGEVFTSATTPNEPLHTGRLPLQPGRQTFLIQSQRELRIEPGQTVSAPCFVAKPMGSDASEEVEVVTARYDPRKPLERHINHANLASPGALSVIGSPLPLDPNSELQRLQRLAIRIELTNFGQDAILIKANEAISHTEHVDVKSQKSQIAESRDAELQRAHQVLHEIEKFVAHEPTMGPTPLTRTGELVEEIAALLVATSKALETNEMPSDKTEHAAATPAASPDDGLDDADTVALPETVPEERVLEDALAALKTVWIDRADLTPQQRLQFMLLMARHIPVFRYVLRPPEQLLTPAERLRIDQNVRPQFTRQYPMPQSRLEEARRIAAELLDQGVVERASSDWNSPVLLVPKKDGTWRFAVDFRRVNKYTNMDPATIPNAKLHLHALGGNNFFTCLDLLSSFWQQPLHPDDRHYTAFSMPGVGQLQWTVLPMGMRNSSQTQQKAMEDLVRGLDPDHVMCYIDDIIIATPDFEQHLILIDLLFRRLEAAGLALKFTKCELLRPSAHYLGHIISADGVAKDPRIVAKLCELPTPTNVAELRAFLGVANYYRDYIPNYSDMTTPLTDQVSPKQPWSWTTVHQRAFEATKAAMQASQLLAYPNWDEKFVLATDASDRGIGGVLAQADGQGGFRPIMFLSRKLSPAESRYCTTEREALAIVTCVSKCRHYLFGRRFLLLTDHNALVHIFGDNAASPVTATGELRHGAKLTRWALQLNTYTYDVQHVEGKRMVVPDYLSRYANASGDEWSAEVTSWFAHPWRGAWDLSHRVFLVTPQDTWTADYLQTLQRQDPVLEAIRSGCNGDPERAERKLTALYNAERATSQQVERRPAHWLGIRIEDFVVQENGLLMRVHVDETTGERREQLVVPPQLRRILLEEKHETHAGHPGAKRTLERLQPRYWWPGMSSDVDAHVAACEKCLRIKPARGRWTNGPLQPLPLAYQPFSRVSVDMVTVAKNNNRYKHILVMVDHATRYLEAVALKTLTEEEVGTAIYHQLFQRYGPVAVLLSDRGKQFTEFAAQSLFRVMGVRHVTTAPYHPETNGLNERTNSTIVSYLRAFAEGDLEHWWKYLGAAAYAYNTAFQSSTRATPYFLMFGRDPVDSIDLLFDAVCVPKKHNIELADWVAKINEARHVAQQHLAVTQAEMAARVNKNRRPATEIEEGALVYYKPRMPYKAKLGAYGLGIYRVLSRKGNFVKLTDTDGTTRDANIRDLVLVREADRGVTELEGYQLLYALLHGANKVPPEASEARPEEVPSELPDPIMAPHKPVAPGLVRDFEVPNFDLDLDSLNGKEELSETMDENVHAENQIEDVPDRITDMAREGRRLKVKVGYAGHPDSPRDTPTWFFFDELDIPQKHEWKKNFERRRKDSLTHTRK
jgi:transposase InsO family protein